MEQGRLPGPNERIFLFCSIADSSWDSHSLMSTSIYLYLLSPRQFFFGEAVASMHPCGGCRTYADGSLKRRYGGVSWYVLFPNKTPQIQLIVKAAGLRHADLSRRHCAVSLKILRPLPTRSLRSLVSHNMGSCAQAQKTRIATRNQNTLALRQVHRSRRNR